MAEREIKVVGWQSPTDEGMASLDIAVEGAGITIKTGVAITKEDLVRVETAIRQWVAAWDVLGSTGGYECENS